ncbi:TldD protein [Tepiditoga spiralis]|uniref:TldD protein n=1 Tax=Tepiditoga spiralis TaxID=2108365 RepID=A0A7G1GA81_9BACT|nr:TldD/PmbA family protein [Tepiditoga spiralis]BBE31032.1 TldD protein [Tepiditoga spiralis]
MLSKETVEKILSTLLKHGGDFAEVFVEDKYDNRIEMKDNKIQKINSGIEKGIGIRGFLGTKSVYAYTNDFTEDNLLKVAKRVGQVLGEVTMNNIVLNFDKTEVQNIHPIHFYPQDIKKNEKVNIMKIASESAKNYSDLIKQVVVNFWDYDQKILVANSEGVFKQDRRIRNRLMINSIAEFNGARESGFYGPGAGMGFEFFNILNPREAGERASRIASRMVKADYIEAGKMPVIISNEFGGVIFHEAVGHALEASSVAKGASVFSGKLGEKVASECVSAVDDPTIPNAWGSANIDDEGTETKRNLLIEKGILKSYMIDKLGGRRMNMESTGSSRRMNYKFAPTSRMSNTFILAGDYYPEEIISNTNNGLYAKSLGGGSVNPSTGEFNFAVNEGYLVENGKITKPVRGATLIGKGYEVIKKIDMVGNDVARGQGMCGAASGSIPADVGQPTIRVSEIVVGGRNK